MKEPELLEIRKLEDVITDFILALDDAIVTYKVIEKIKKDDSKPNQLLFCHIINRFDSFVYEFLETIVLSDENTLHRYLDENKKLEEKALLKDVLYISENGSFLWMQNQIGDTLENDLKRKRHAQKFEMLLDSLDINSKKIFVYLMGSGEFASGCLKNTPIKKKTPNHKTTPEEIIGYADLLYEKRNAVTHNRNTYRTSTLKRLNDEWKLKITNTGVIIRTDTIKSLIRFYTSVGLQIIESEKVKGKILTSYENIRSELEILKKIEPLGTRKKGEDERFINGGIINRRKILKSSTLKSITRNSYMNLVNVDPSTARRDIKAYIDEGFLMEGRGKRKRNQPIKYLLVRSPTI